MKRIISFGLSLFLLITGSKAYEIKNSENIAGYDSTTSTSVGVKIDHSNFDNFYYKSSDAGKTIEYVSSYTKGARTALQVCSVGSKESSAKHKPEYVYDELYMTFPKSEIIEIKKPTCVNDGYIKIKCKHQVSVFLGMGKKDCGETATIILKKSNYLHGAQEHKAYQDAGICEYCNKVKHDEEIAHDKTTEEYHYLECSYPGCNFSDKRKHTYNNGEVECRVCGYTNTKHQPLGGWQADEDGHYKACANPDCEICEGEYIRGEHFGAMHPEGKCAECGFVYETHNITIERGYSEDKHWYKCGFSGCEEYHEEEEHIKTIKPTGNDNTGHWYICTADGCGVEFGKTAHTGGTHDNGGKCEVCDFPYKEHGKGELVNTDPEYHWYKCTSCQEPYSEKELHTLKENSKKEMECSVCGYIDSSHKATGDWIQEEKVHYKKCAVEDCEQQWEKGEHAGGSHPKGLCSTCNYEYQKHEKDENKYITFDETNHIYGCTYKENNVLCEGTHKYKHEKSSDFAWEENTHWYKCIDVNCEKRFDEVPHNYEINPESGKVECTICKLEKPNHIAKPEWSEKCDKEIHFKECQVEGCTEHRFFEGEHIGGTHGNGGMCEVCEFPYQTHNPDTSKFDSDETDHWYGCSFEGCLELFKAPHKQGTQAKGSDATHHWFECKDAEFPECKKAFEKQEHYDEDNNNICDACKKDYKTSVKVKIKKGENGEEGYRILDKKGDSVQLEAEISPKNSVYSKYPLIWISNNEKIASVDKDTGVVKALKEDGIVIITVKIKDKEIPVTEAMKCEIYIGDSALKITTEQEEMYENKKLLLTTNFDDKGVEIVWEADDEKEKYGKIIEKEDPENPGKILTYFESEKDAADGKNDGVKVKLTAKLKSGMKDSITIKIVHKDGNHDNDGECSVCGYTYQKHTESEYKKENANDTHHWKVCSYLDCKGKKIDSEKHTSSTSCSECGWKKNNSAGDSTPGDNTPGDNTPGDNTPGDNTPGDNTSKEEYTGSDDDFWYIKINDLYHKKISKATLRVAVPKEKHTVEAGEECVCGAIFNCDHRIGKKLHQWISPTHHSSTCTFCKKTLGEEYNEEHTFNDNGFCIDCGSNIDGTLESLDTELFIAVKEYYVEEDEPEVDIKFDYQVKDDVIGEFVWTMSTAPDPNKKYSSNNGDVSTDGTIKFWYHEDGDEKMFKADLVEPAAELSKESVITITLYDQNGQEYTQRIKLIKSGPPRSVCRIYLDKDMYSVEDNEIKIIMQTQYLDFEDETVIRDGWAKYEIEDDIVDIVADPEDGIFKIVGEPTIEELESGMKYLITAPIEIIDEENLGNQKITVKLTTKYEYNDKHQKVTKDRTYTDVVRIVKDPEEVTTGGGSTGGGGTGSGTEGSGSTGGSGVLAAIGAGALLLLLAVIGASMNNRR